jgi:hypothetical protein
MAGLKEVLQAERLATNTANSDAQAKYGTDKEEVRDDILALETASCSGPALATTLALKVTSVAGADEATPPGEIYEVTGMSATSVVVAVLHISTAASVATIETVAPALFTPGTDTLTSLTEVDRSNDQLLVFWYDV